MKTKGYKGMLRDRLPKTIDIALKWCKAKEKWIDHTYHNFVQFLSDKEDRDEATRIILGISKKYREFDFHKSIMWDNLSEEETHYWQNVETWVNWFRVKYIYVQNEYNNSLSLGLNIYTIKQKIKKNFLSSLNEEWQEKLCNYLISTL